jgi:hypothetical protein
LERIRGGNVLIALGMALNGDEDVAAPYQMEAV